MSDDRVFDLYEGRIGNKVSRNDLAGRIEWTFSRIPSGPVLDVGCSQGLLAVLLARRGLNVTGIDINSAAIAYANSKRDIEPASVRQRIVFECTTVDTIPDASFRVLVLGEVLEHVPDPKNMLANCLQKLEAGGKAIIQVPFGLHPHPDHFTVFYAGKLAEMLPSSWSITRLQMRGGRLCAELQQGSGLELRDFLYFDERYFLEKEVAYADRVRHYEAEYQRWRARAMRLEVYKKRYEVMRSALLRPWKWPLNVFRFFIKRSSKGSGES